MQDTDFARLEAFLDENAGVFKPFGTSATNRKRSLYDNIMRTLYLIKWSRR